MKITAWITLAIITFAATVQAQGTPANVESVDFKYAPGKSTLEIKFDKEVTFEKMVSDSTKQVVIEVKGAKIKKLLARKLDTSSFKTNVTLINPYQSGDSVRFALQLKEAGDVDLNMSGNTITAAIDNKQSATKAEEQDMATLDPKNLGTVEEQTATAEVPKATETDTEENKTADGNLKEFMESSETKQYVGRKITLQLRDADIQDIFRAISEASEFNIVLSDDVRGKMTINLVQVPWDQVLDIVLKTNKLGAERSGNVLRVASLDALTKEKEAELAAHKAEEAIEPLVVKIFPLSYAKIDDLKKILDDFLSKDVALGTGKETAQKRGSIQIDQRTNSLVVRETPSTMEKIKRIIKELDNQTPQILIEAKFVEVSENKNKELSGRIWATSREVDSSGAMAFNNNRTNWGNSFGGSGFQDATSLPSSFALTPVQGAAFGFSPRSNILGTGSLREVSAFLGILEAESQAKIIASPRVIAQNKEAAEISQGKSFTLATTAGANSSGAFQTVTANLKLSVTPQVTSDGSINLKLNFSQEAPSKTPAGASLALDTKKIDTTVLVDSGSTLVIGGIYTSQVNESSSGIPFLRDIPLLGIFFGSKSTTIDKGELFIFLTPRIVNEKESGFQG